MKTRLPPQGSKILLAFAALMTSYHLIFRQYLPLPNGLMGHDYVLTLGGFLDGYFWFRNNGFFTPPWFTPSFCGGQAFFADPQSAFYSLPQFLTFFIDPVQAVYWAFLVFAALGFWGMYLYMRSCLGQKPHSALVAATVFMFNGFYVHRMMIGHYGYQSFMLVPLIAFLLLPKQDAIGADQRRDVIFSLIAGTLIAYWFHSGLTTLIVPAALSVITLACFASMNTGWTRLKIFATRGIFASIVALGICASKLNANLTLMSGASRDYYPLPGLASWQEIFTFVFKSLFYSSEHVFRWVTPHWKNMQWSALPHELAYGVTPIAAAIILIGLARILIGKEPEQNASIGQASNKAASLCAITLLMAIILIPLALLYYSPEWNAILKSVPLIGSTTSPFRWLIIYIPLISLLTGLLVPSLGKLKLPLVGLCIAGIPLLNYLENRDFYLQQSFDPKPYVEYYEKVSAGSIQPHIRAIADPRTEDGQQIIDNSLFLEGFSPIRCYNPLFGYRQEKLVMNTLTAAPTDYEPRPGWLNMHNPACFVFPTENSCNKWDSFRVTESDKLNNFVSYRPFEFEKSLRQRIADWISLLTISLLLPLVGFFVFFGKKK